MKFTYTDFSFLKNEVMAIESDLKKAYEQFIQTTVLFEARTLASRNLPNDQDESIEPYLTTIKGFYNKLKHEVSIWLQGGVQKTLGAVNVATANQNIENKEKEVQQETDKLDRMTVDRSRMCLDCDQASYKKQRTWLIIFGAGDCVWTASAFLKFGDVMIIAIAIGLFIGIAQTSAVKSTTQIIKEVEYKKSQKMYAIIAIVAALIVSYCLALLRYWFIHAGAAANVPFIIMNPTTFMIINLLFIAATSLIVIFHYPTKAQIKEMHKAEALDKEIQMSQHRCKELNAELNILRKQREFIMELRSRVIHAESMLHEKINKLFDEAVGIFKHENTVKRTDGIFPQVFKNPHKTLSNDDNDNVPLLEN